VDASAEKPEGLLSQYDLILLLETTPQLRTV